MRAILIIMIFFLTHWASAVDLRVATYNLMNRYAPQAMIFPGWDSRSQAIANWTTESGIDVLGTQEGTESMINDLGALLPGYTRVGRPRSNSKWFGEYTAIFFRKDKFNLEDSGDFWFSETPEVPGSSSWGAANVRMATWVKLRDLQGRSFVFFNSHFDHVSARSRTESSRILLERIRAIDTPAIAVGDLNAEPDDPSIHSLCQSLIEARAVTPNFGARNSYFLGWQLDHVFSTSDLAPVRFDIQNPRTSRGFATSDHRPVVVDYEFK